MNNLIHIPYNESIIRDFRNNLEINIGGINEKLVAEVYGIDDYINKVYPLFNKIFKCTNIKNVGQGYVGFEIVPNPSLNKYITNLKYIYQTIMSNPANLHEPEIKYYIEWYPKGTMCSGIPQQLKLKSLSEITPEIRQGLLSIRDRQGNDIPVNQGDNIMKTYKDKYYLEEVIQPKDDDSDDIIRIILGCQSHSACIEILGNPKQATDRMMIILTALNKE